MTALPTAPQGPGFAPVAEREDLKCKVFRRGRADRILIDLGTISEILAEPDSLVWLDVVDPKAEDLEVLREEFNLHPLAIEDAVTAHERPKIESYETYWFVVVTAVSMVDRGLHFHEVAIFAGSRFLVTVRHEPAYLQTEVEKRRHAHPESMRDGGFLLYTILDTVVDQFIPVAETFQDRVDALSAARTVSGFSGLVLRW